MNANVIWHTYNRFPSILKLIYSVRFCRYDFLIDFIQVWLFASLHHKEHFCYLFFFCVWWWVLKIHYVFTFLGDSIMMLKWFSRRFCLFFPHSIAVAVSDVKFLFTTANLLLIWMVTEFLFNIRNRLKLNMKISNWFLQMIEHISLLISITSHSIICERVGFWGGDVHFKNRKNPAYQQFPSQLLQQHQFQDDSWKR